MSSELSVNMTQLQELAAEVSKTHQPTTIGLTRDVVAVLKPSGRRRTARPGRTPTPADIEAAWSAFGSWKDEDVDAFLKNNEESRRLSSRPPVTL